MELRLGVVGERRGRRLAPSFSTFIVSSWRTVGVPRRAESEPPARGVRARHRLDGGQRAVVTVRWGPLSPSPPWPPALTRLTVAHRQLRGRDIGHHRSSHPIVRRRGRWARRPWASSSSDQSTRWRSPPLPRTGSTVVDVTSHPLQRRTLRVLATAQVFGAVGFFLGVTVAALLARDVSGRESLGGVPLAFAVLAGALAAAPIGTARLPFVQKLLDRSGRLA